MTAEATGHRRVVSANDECWVFSAVSDDFCRIWAHPLDAHQVSNRGRASLREHLANLPWAERTIRRTLLLVEPAPFRIGGWGLNHVLVLGVRSSLATLDAGPMAGYSTHNSPGSVHKTACTVLCLPEVFTATRRVGPRGSRATMSNA